MSSRSRVLFLPEWIDFQADVGVAAYAREARWTLTGISHYGGDFDLVHGQQVDGIITLLIHPNSKQARFVEEAGLPAVDMVNEIPALDVPRVLADNEAIGRMAAEHLMARGLEHLAFLTFSNSFVTRERRHGFTSTVEQCGRTCHSIDVQEALESDLFSLFEDRVTRIAARLAQLPKPLGIMLQFDGYVHYITEACRMADLSIPEQVAVVGVDNTEAICEWGELRLSSVDSNRKKHGYEAAVLLARLMAGESPPPEPIRVKPLRVVVRESSDVLAIADTRLKSAVEHIRNQWSDPDFGVEDVVQASSLSRCQLYKLFEKHMGRGIKEVLTGFRIAEARRLLAKTDMKIYAVAMQAGFKNEKHLMRTFKRVVGVTPTTFRTNT